MGGKYLKKANFLRQYFTVFFEDIVMWSFGGSLNIKTIEIVAECGKNLEKV